MSDYVFKLPDVGEGIASAEIVAWHVSVGDTVKEDQPLVDVMTDKATVEIGAPVAGRIVRRSGEPGAMAQVGSELVVIETGATAAGRSEASVARPAPAAKGSPPQAPAPVQPAAADRSAQASPAKAHGKVQASPAVRDRARRLGIDLVDIVGSGESGRIEHADLDAVLLKGRAMPAPARPPALSASAAGDVVEEVAVIGLRRQIANAMQDSKRRIPHFAYVEEIDVTNLEALRAKLNDRYGDERPRLTLLPFLILAMVRGVAEHRGINAHYDDEHGIIRRHSAVHMGVATETPRGLVVPVVRDAEARDLWNIAAEIARLTDAARSGKATRDELSGSTITVSSLGKLGGIMATPIIKPPEVAIVGVNKIAERPVVLGGDIVVRKMMNLSSSFDHRVVDGYDGAAFIQTLKGILEAPAELFIP